MRDGQRQEIWAGRRARRFARASDHAHRQLNARPLPSRGIRAGGWGRNSPYYCLPLHSVDGIGARGFQECTPLSGLGAYASGLSH